ncbi:probable helicase with zinc finger domain [Gigantopelta aegis]|uniref:probable helicase with zinc finger domain n=1 Tax=Gigantopelta aegis TaxID=1735272 RepID=UPI001B88B3E7|nr:probable helicase with zinc finger domain [Gigantopelta aegis]
MDDGASDVLDNNAGNDTSTCMTSYDRPSGVEGRAEEDDGLYSRTKGIKGKSESAPDGTSTADAISSITALIKQRQYSEALDVCEQALQKTPHNEKLLEKKIKVFCHLGHFQEAFDLASEWEKKVPQHPIALKELNRLKIVLAALQDQDSEDESPSTPELPLTHNGNDNITNKTTTPENSKAEDRIAEPALPKATNIVLSLPAQPSSKKQSNLENISFDCTFCNLKFEKQRELEKHCRSELHKKKLTSDEGQDWKFRAPPRGLNNDEYILCHRYSETGRCPFGEKCTQAHSEEELGEWRERFKFRKQQLQRAKDSHLHGNTYTEQLLERLVNTESPKAVLVQNLDFVKLHVNSDLKVNMTHKKCTNAWTFTVTSKICLHSVALLDDTNRSYFYVSSISVGPKKTQKYQNLENQCQEWINQDTHAKGHGEYVYRIKVVFKTDLYGTFRQTIVFDFSVEAVLTREMQVESSPVVDAEDLSKFLILTEAKKWSEDKVEIVSFQPRSTPVNSTEKHLLEKYKLPQPDKFTLSDTIMQSVSKDNYRLWMHEMMYLEEMAQIGFIQRYNIRTSLQLVNRFLLMPGAMSTAKFAHDGQLFARMKLEDNLSQDSMGGRLILLNAQTAWIAADSHDLEKKEAKPDKAYEVVIEDKGKNFIFLRVSAQCVKELGLTCDEEFKAQVQFQLNRLSKCEMHSAVDKLSTLDIVFPDIDKIPSISFTDRDPNEDLDSKLNVKQKEAIMGVLTDLDVQLPPLLIVGPFGTGKTFTMAQAARQVVRQHKEARILICTLSNSAADLYIGEFFHRLVKDGNEDMRPLRVYYMYRWVQTVPEVVLEYTLYQTSGDHAGTFRYPNLEDLDKHRIVITTLSTARTISDLDLPKDYFTHIFIDEAAQALEIEVLIPLSLAGKKTRIVLAGDHMQLSPELYSDFTRQQGFQMTLLERLYEYYPPDCPCKVMLCENYRSHSAIVEFTSELFYDNKLITSGNLTAHSSIYPLTFYMAKGEEIQHQNSTGFFNNSEVYEIVERVEELQRKWPDDWGPLEDNSIGVLAPYTDQVQRIRAEMRKKKMFNVAVERVLNVQGKQYRAIVLSTVRTRHTCRSDTSEEDIMDYGFLSNVKLLNTAITRAQSLVMVVGDPVSLCLVGKCRKVWEYFIEICSQNSSFHGLTWSQLRSQLESAEMAKTYVLNPLAPEFVPNRLFHVTIGEAENFMQNQQSFAHSSSQQHHGAHHPAAAAAYGSPLVTPMCPQPFVPYYSLPFYHGHGYYGPMMCRPVVPRRQNSPVSSRTVSPKPSSQPVSSVGPKLRINGVKPSIEPFIEASPLSSPGAVPVRAIYKQSKGRVMMIPPRMPMPYPPYYPMMPPYLYMPEDPRYSMQPHPYIFHGPRLPYPPVYPYPTHLPSGPEHPHHSGSVRRASNSPEIPVERIRPSVAGQPIRLMPGVVHVPPHLFQKGSPDSDRGSSYSSSPAISPPSAPQRDTEREGTPERHATPTELRSTPTEMRGTPVERIEPPVERISTPIERRGTPVSERPYSPANYTSEKMSRHVTNRDGAEDVLRDKVNRKHRPGQGNLKLNTGFSRQFSDDLPTPTEIVDLVRMIEESIEETNEDADSAECAPMRIEIKTNGPANQKHREQIARCSSESPSSDRNGEKLSYAGVLRKHSLPDPPTSLDSGSIEEQIVDYEQHTPRTPSGFVTPGVDIDMDPFGILKSLNIEAPSHHVQ